jgi:pyruvate formate lyase activating enzyme
MKEASFYTKEQDGSLSCLLCPHNCRIIKDRSGICGARINQNGELMTRNYGIITGASFDPIEKKPLYHFYPGSQILSVGTVGCNLHCPFCQNYTLSRYFDDGGRSAGTPVDPVELERMLENGSFRQKGIFRGVAFTYSEPMVWFEFVRDAGTLVRNKGGMNVLVTNGFINPEPLAELIPLVSAANVDLKAFTEEHYSQLGGKLAPVLSSIEKMKEGGVHIEITTLVVTGLNDTLDEIENIAKWISRLDRKIPYHLSRYFPQYRYEKHATEISFLHEAYDAARAHLDYVYVGNTGVENDTVCPSCGNTVVSRTGFSARCVGINEGSCSQCTRPVDFVGV